MQKLQINFFKDEYEKFSNFYPVLVFYDHAPYTTVEHAFVAAKTTDVLLRKKVSEIPASDTGRVKKFGRTLHLRPNWDLMKISIMRILLEQKFSYVEFKDLLLSTKDIYLEEGNYWHDNFWGNCHCKKCVNIEGLNNLGKLLMSIRDTLE